MRVAVDGGPLDGQTMRVPDDWVAVSARFTSGVRSGLYRVDVEAGKATWMGWQAVDGRIGEYDL